jgi:hypothetical protein
MSNRQKMLVVIGFVAGTILTLIVGTELYLEHLGAGDPIIYYTNNTYRYAPLPNQHKKRLNGAWVTIDATGLRTPEPWNADADVRILFVGNSITWSGTSIDDKATFPFLTCLNLEKRTGLRFTCGNAGVSAYGTDNMTARLRYQKLNNEQAVVVTLIYPDMLRGLTELQRNYFFSSTPKGPLPALWEVGTIGLFRLSYWLRHHSLVHYGETGRGEPGPVLKDDLAVAGESLSRLLAVLKQKVKEGKTVLVVLSPLAAELGGKESAFTKLARRLLSDSGLASIDMNGPVTQQYKEGFFIDGRHLGLEAHSLYGSAIAEALSGRLATTQKPVQKPTFNYP